MGATEGPLQRSHLSPPAHVYSVCTYSALVCQNVTLDVKHLMLGRPSTAAFHICLMVVATLLAAALPRPKQQPGMHALATFLSTDYHPCGAAGGGADGPALGGTAPLCQLSLGHARHHRRRQHHPHCYRKDAILDMASLSYFHQSAFPGARGHPCKVGHAALRLCSGRRHDGGVIVRRPPESP